MSPLDEIHQGGVDALVASVGIPPQPHLLGQLQKEMREEEPDPARVVAITSKDVGLSAAVLKVVNSPLFSLNRQVSSLEQATLLLGMRALSSLVTGMLARQALQLDGPVLNRFWDVSAKRSQAMQYFSRKLRLAAPDVAQTFGLFCDMGIPLLMRKFPNYVETLKIANLGADEGFTALERTRHQTDHALIGAIMAKTWGLSPDIALAIRVHHDYELFGSNRAPQLALDLTAMGLLAERGIQQYCGMNRSMEWERGGQAALDHLGLSVHDMDNLLEDVQQVFSSE